MSEIGFPTGASLLSFLAACTIIACVIVGVIVQISNEEKGNHASTYRMRSYVIYTNDTAQQVYLMRCVKVCNPPDTSRWWRIESGDYENIPMHDDSEWTVVLDADRTVQGCLHVPRFGPKLVMRNVSGRTPCPTTVKQS